MRNNPKISRYIQRISQIHDKSGGDLTVAHASLMLAILKCLERALTSYLSRMKL